MACGDGLAQSRKHGQAKQAVEADDAGQAAVEKDIAGCSQRLSASGHVKLGGILVAPDVPSPSAHGAAAACRIGVYQSGLARIRAAGDHTETVTHQGSIAPIRR